MRRAPGIYANAAVPCPMAVGVLRPVVLVPEALSESPLLEWMLRHELTHITRGHIVCKAVLLSSHILSEVNAVCDKVLIMSCLLYTSDLRRPGAGAGGRIRRGPRRGGKGCACRAGRARALYPCLLYTSVFLIFSRRSAAGVYSRA